MEHLVADGVTLAVERVGRGEPVVFIHGALIADAFRPLLFEPTLTKSYRLVTYRRRGYEGSSKIPGTIGVQQQASDCRSLINRLVHQKVHLVGHSFGGAVALQLALDAPTLVHSLVLLEPALMVGESGRGYRQSLENGIRQYRSQNPEAVVDAMLSDRWPGYREGLEKVMPGAFFQAVIDSSASFESELPALLEWSFGEKEARQLTQPVLSVLGEESSNLSPRFKDTHNWLLATIESAEGYVLPDAHHFLQIENPKDMATALGAFFARHPI